MPVLADKPRPPSHPTIGPMLRLCHRLPIRPGLLPAAAQRLGGRLLLVAALGLSWQAGVQAAGPVHAPTRSAPAVELKLASATHLELERYMGLWYKVAKIDRPKEEIHTRERFELMQRYDGTVRAIYASYLPMSNRWDRVEDYMEPIDRQGNTFASHQRMPLPVTFRVPRFGPFAVTFELLALDPRYQWAIVKGPTPGALFILSRSNDVAPETRRALDKLAQKLHSSSEPLHWAAAETSF